MARVSFNQSKAKTSHPIKNKSEVKHTNALARVRQNKREFPTWSSEWKRIRKYVLQLNPLCVHCEAKGITEEARHVDHKDEDSTNNNYDNLQGLCVSCHMTKTGKARGNEHKLNKVQVMIVPDVEKVSSYQPAGSDWFKGNRLKR